MEHTPHSEPRFQVKILEVNAEPAIELTGPRLTWILKDLFASTAKVCVDPFVEKKRVSDIHGIWGVGENREHLIKCLDENLRGPYVDL